MSTGKTRDGRRRGAKRACRGEAARRSRRARHAVRHARGGAGSGGLRAAGVALELGGHKTETFTSADLVVLSPGVPLDQPAVQAARERGRRGHRRSGARVAMAAGPRDRHHRHEREVDDDRIDGTDSRSGGLHGDGGRQHRPAAERAGGRVDARDAARRRDEQLSARADRDVSPVDRGDAEFLARPSRPSSERRRVRRGEGADLRKPGRGRLGGDQRRRSRRARARAARARRRSGISRGTSRSTEGTAIEDGWIVDRGRERRPNGSCRSTRFTCSARTWSPT